MRQRPVVSRLVQSSAAARSPIEMRKTGLVASWKSACRRLSKKALPRRRFCNLVKLSRLKVCRTVQHSLAALSRLWIMDQMRVELPGNPSVVREVLMKSRRGAYHDDYVNRKPFDVVELRFTQSFKVIGINTYPEVLSKHLKIAHRQGIPLSRRAPQCAEVDRVVFADLSYRSSTESSLKFVARRAATGSLSTAVRMLLPSSRARSTLLTVDSAASAFWAATSS